MDANNVRYISKVIFSEFQKVTDGGVSIITPDQVPSLICNILSSLRSNGDICDLLKTEECINLMTNKVKTLTSYIIDYPLTDIKALFKILTPLIWYRNANYDVVNAHYELNEMLAEYIQPVLTTQDEKTRSSVYLRLVDPKFEPAHYPKYYYALDNKNYTEVTKDFILMLEQTKKFTIYGIQEVPFGHILESHLNCGDLFCPICTGLNSCLTCGKGEAELATHCPGSNSILAPAEDCLYNVVFDATGCKLQRTPEEFDQYMTNFFEAFKALNTCPVSTAEFTQMCNEILNDPYVNSREPEKYKEELRSLLELFADALLVSHNYRAYFKSGKHPEASNFLALIKEDYEQALNLVRLLDARSISVYNKLNINYNVIFKELGLSKRDIAKILEPLKELFHNHSTQTETSNQQLILHDRAFEVATLKDKFVTVITDQHPDLIFKEFMSQIDRTKILQFGTITNNDLLRAIKSSEGLNFQETQEFITVTLDFKPTYADIRKLYGALGLRVTNMTLLIFSTPENAENLPNRIEPFYQFIKL